MKESKTDKVIVNKDWCKGCGICVAFCPTNTLEMKEGKVEIVDMDACIECGLCELRCPDFAIYLGGRKDEK